MWSRCCLQSRPSSLPAPWFCPPCGRDVFEVQPAHDNLRHEWKQMALCCGLCGHQDIACDDFADHMGRDTSARVVATIIQGSGLLTQFLVKIVVN